MALTREELIVKYVKTKEEALKGPIVEQYQPLVEYIARKLTFNRDDLKDLVQVGNIGLLRSLDRFDPGMETDFSTFATPNIIGEIKHYFRDKKGLVKIPRKLQETHSKIKKYTKEKMVAGHSPTVSEIAMALEIDEEQVLESMEAGQSSLVISLDTPAYKKSNSQASEGSTLLDTLGMDAQEDFYLDKVTLNEALDTLSKREQRIIFLRYYNGLSQTDISKRMGLSQMHISRLLTKAIKRLRVALEHTRH